MQLNVNRMLKRRLNKRTSRCAEFRDENYTSAKAPSTGGSSRIASNCWYENYSAELSKLSRSFLAEVKAECKMSLTRRLISTPCFENFPLNDLSSFLATFIIRNQQNHLICRFEKGNGESKKIFWIKVAATEIGFELTFFIPNFFFNPIIEVLLHSDTSSNLRRGAFREFWQNNLIRFFSCELTFS